MTTTHDDSLPVLSLAEIDRACDADEPLVRQRDAIAALAHMRQRLEEAEAIADESMFSLLETECIGQDDRDSVLGLTNDGQGEVATLAEASDAIREAFAWLEPRGYVRLSRDGSGEYIDVLRRPGEDDGANDSE